MANVREAAADFVGFFSKTRSPSYHKLNHEDSSDPESGSPHRAGRRRGILALANGRLSLKPLLGIVAATWLILICLFYGVRFLFLFFVNATQPEPS